jgi:hypothetical protein
MTTFTVFTLAEYPHRTGAAQSQTWLSPHADGAPLDPWMQTHWKIGAEIMRVCPESMRISRTVADWEKWAAMQFPDNGTYVVGANR